MKQFIALFLLLVGVILIAAWATNPNSINRLLPKSLRVPTAINLLPTPIPELEKKTVSIGNFQFTVEVARSSTERSKGLSGRNSLEADHGMLFVFDSQNVRPSFWMKDTNIPLDIIWINDGKIAQITGNLQPVTEGTPDNKVPLFLPHDSIDYVLEVLGGTAEENKIRVGDIVVIPSFE